MNRPVPYPRQRLLVLLVMLVATGVVVHQADASQTARPPLNDVLDEAALIAHVRIAGTMSFGERPVTFVEIIRSARGPAAGQVAVISAVTTNKEASPAWNSGEEFILFAELKADGFHHPLPEGLGRWRVAKDGSIVDTLSLREIIPLQAPATACGAMAHLAEAFRRRDARLDVRLNESELRAYEYGASLHVEIVVENTGEEILRLPNHIAYEYRQAHWVDIVRRQERMKQLGQRTVKVCLQPLNQLSQIAETARLERLAESLAVMPGQRAVASYDLAQEYGLHGGGRFLVWAELGALRSPPVLLELPESELAEEAVMAMEDLAIDDDGPFHIVQGAKPTRRVMPPVEPTVHAAAIDAALGWWFGRRTGISDSDKQPDEVVFLRPSLLPAEFTSRIEGVQFAVTDLRWRRDGEHAELQTSRGAAMFRYRTLEIRSVHVQGNRARVELIQNRRHNLGGSGAAIEMHRDGGRWRVDDRVLVWES